MVPGRLFEYEYRQDLSEMFPVGLAELIIPASSSIAATVSFLYYKRQLACRFANRRDWAIIVRLSHDPRAVTLCAPDAHTGIILRGAKTVTDTHSFTTACSDLPLRMNKKGWRNTTGRENAPKVVRYSFPPLCAGSANKKRWPALRSQNKRRVQHGRALSTFLWEAVSHQILNGWLAQCACEQREG
jgi:hypothetical protein